MMILTLGKDVSSPSLAIWLSEDHGNLRLTPEKLNYSFHIIVDMRHLFNVYTQNCLQHITLFYILIASEMKIQELIVLL